MAIKVKSYKRRLKSGKIVTVQGYSKIGKRRWDDLETMMVNRISHNRAIAKESGIPLAELKRGIIY